jgi:hypothetical protein
VFAIAGVWVLRIKPFLPGCYNRDSYSGTTRQPHALSSHITYREEGHVFPPRCYLRRLNFCRPSSLLNELHYIPPNLKAVGLFSPIPTLSVPPPKVPRLASNRMAPSMLMASRIRGSHAKTSPSHLLKPTNCQTGSCVAVRGLRTCHS